MLLSTLESLILKGNPVNQLAMKPRPAPASGEGGTKLAIPCDLIHPAPQQPRTTFDPVLDKELEESIRAHGVLQPIGVTKDGDGTYTLVFGERRWRQARAIDPRFLMPAVLRPTMTAIERFTEAVAENVDRDNLTPLDQARSVKFFMDNGLTIAEAAKRMNRSEKWAADMLLVLNLDPSLHWRFLPSTPANQRLTAPTAQRLGRVKSPELQRQLAEESAHLPNAKASVHIATRTQFVSSQSMHRPFAAPAAPVTSIIQLLQTAERTMERAAAERKVLTPGQKSQARASALRIKQFVETCLGRL